MIVNSVVPVLHLSAAEWTAARRICHGTVMVSLATSPLVLTLKGRQIMIVVQLQTVTVTGVLYCTVLYCTADRDCDQLT